MKRTQKKAPPKNRDRPVDDLQAALVLADLAVKLRLADLEIEALS